MNWFRWRIGRLAYAPDSMLEQESGYGYTWRRIVGPFYWATGEGEQS